MEFESVKCLHKCRNFPRMYENLQFNARTTDDRSIKFLSEISKSKEIEKFYNNGEYASFYIYIYIYILRKIT